MLAILLILVAVFGFYFLKQYKIQQKVKAFTPPAVPVTTLEAQSEQWTSTLTSVGHITSDKSVSITPQLAGQILSINVESGSEVQKGDVLVQLDDRLLQANLATSKANLSLAQLEYDRQKRLLKTHSVSQDAVDSALAKLQTSQADVQYILTQIDFMKIKAPFHGTVGLRHINIGDFIQPGESLIELQNRDKQYIDFSLPERYIPQIQVGQTVSFNTDAYGSNRYNATVSAIGSSVDDVSRNIDVRATINDSTAQFVAGMYIEAEVVTHNSQTVIPVPVVAVSYSLYGDTVFVVSHPDATNSRPSSSSSADAAAQETVVEARTVTVGSRRNGWVGILEGLQPGDQVITSNQQQLKKGTVVVVNNSRPFPAQAGSKTSGQ
ncbi:MULTISPECIES: efflux RND transporter periplasmic adaptor subunit [Ferrimonas]|uniref:efflux RND transporter periplasmic adaptor subunit n=1 Tax=Ferrimonas TaxID=44011 RepID=UPI00146ACF93|nr:MULTISPECIES: efflux RND transporter periplasmic adaptor subunit [Ferrimonas]USD35883.1 efflux RND transporter periplasmic adaptor subunit [Ferrimonas sp. SCSIO 43195]